MMPNNDGLPIFEPRSSFYNTIPHGIWGGLIFFGNMNTTDKLGQTPLHYAIRSGNNMIVERLLADPDFVYPPQPDLPTRKSFISALSKKLPNLATRLPNGMSYLHFAVQLGNVDAICLLLSKQIDRSIRDRWGLTAKQRASSRLIYWERKDNQQMINKMEEIITLLEGTPISSCSTHESEDDSDRNENEDEDKNNNRNEADPDNRLLSLLKSGHTGEYILSSFINYITAEKFQELVDQKEGGGLRRSPLHYVAMMPNKEGGPLFAILGDVTMNLDVTDREGFTPVHYAIKAGNFSILLPLFSNFYEQRDHSPNVIFDVNKQLSNKMTYLHYAVQYADVEATCFLLMRDIDETPKDKWNLTARQRAGLQLRHWKRKGNQLMVSNMREIIAILKDPNHPCRW